MPGKLDPDVLAAYALSRTGADDAAVRQGPAYGEDAAAIDVGGETLVASSDPISLAADRVGTLGVHVACNDVAACGGDPRWLTSVVFLPGGREDSLDAITEQLDAAAADVGVAIVGGHSEFLSALSTPLLSLTALGLADRYVPTGGARPGDRVLLTKGAGVEATAILATDFRDRVADAVPAALLERAAGFYDEISVVPDARVVRSSANAMHDPTEGGVLGGLYELAAASGVRIDVDRDAVPVREETRRLCDAVGVDPLRVLGSGSLLASVPPEACDDALAAFDAAGIAVADVGGVDEADDPALVVDGRTVRSAVRDEMYDLWEET